MTYESPRCQHGCLLLDGAADGSIAGEDEKSWEGTGFEHAILEFYSACDCCGLLMHKDTPYQLLADGRTLCGPCEETE